MAYEKLKKKRGFDPGMDDGEFLRRMKADDPAFSGMDDYAFVRAANRAESEEGSGAEAEPASLARTQAKQRPRISPGMLGASLAPGILGIPGGGALGRFGANLGVEQLKDAGAVAQAAGAMALRGPGGLVNVPPEQQVRAAAAGVGTAAGAGIGGALGRTAAGPALRGILSGAGAGASDAAIRSGGDLPSAAGGAALGVALGGVFGKMAPAIGKKLSTPLEQPFRTPIQRLRAKSPFSSTSSRLEALSPEGEELGRLLETSLSEGEIAAGGPSLTMRRAGLGSVGRPPVKKILSPKAWRVQRQEKIDLARAMDGKLERDKLSERAQPVYDAWVRYRASVVPRARAAGMRVGEITQYYPHDQLTVKEMAKPWVRKEQTEAAWADGRFKTLEEAQAVYDDTYKLLKSGGRSGGDLAAQHLASEGQGDPQSLKQIILGEQYRATKERAPHLEMERKVNFPFYNRDPVETLPRYIEGTEARIKDAEIMGPNLERLRELQARTPSQEERDALEYLFKAARGDLETKDFGWMGSFLRLLRKGGTFALSPVSSVKNLQQGPTGSMMITDPMSVLRGAATMFTQRGRELPIRSGAASEGAVRSFEHLVGGKPGITRFYMNMIGFSPAERRFNRGISSNSGIQYLFKQIRQLEGGGVVDKLAERSPIFEKISRMRKIQAALEMKRMGIDPEQVMAGGMTRADMLRAAYSVTRRGQFRSHELDLPDILTKTEARRTMGQFKGFPYQQSQMGLKEVYDRIIHPKGPLDRLRGLRNLAILGTIYPLTGEVVGEIVSAMTGKKRETSWKESPFRRYMEDLTLGVPFGIIADLFTALEYSPLEWAVGPGIARPVKAFMTGKEIVKRQQKGKEPTPYQKRTLGRLVPTAGPLLVNRMFPSKEKEEKEPSRTGGRERRANAR